MTIERDGAGRWLPGSTPNPSGRRPGAGKVAALRETLINGALEGVLSVVHSAALKGDMAAARLLIERCIPTVRATGLAMPIELTGDTLSEKGRSILQQVADGAIAPAEAGELLAALGHLSSITANDEMEARLVAIEARMKAGSDQ